MYCLVFAALLAVAAANPTNLYGGGLIGGHGVAIAPVAVRSLGYSSKINHVAAAPIAIGHGVGHGLGYAAGPIAVGGLGYAAGPIAVGHGVGAIAVPVAVRSLAYSSKINHIAAAPVLAHAAPIVGPIGYGGHGLNYGGAIGLAHGAPIAVGAVATRAVGYSSKVNHIAPIAVAHHAAPVVVAHHAAPIAVAHHAAPVLAINNYKGSAFLH